MTVVATMRALFTVLPSMSLDTTSGALVSKIQACRGMRVKEIAYLGVTLFVALFARAAVAAMFMRIIFSSCADGRNDSARVIP